MKVSFIVVYSSTKSLALLDRKCWPKIDERLDKLIMSQTIRLLNQIKSIPIEKEILLMDNTGNFPPELIDGIKIVKSHGAWEEHEYSKNVETYFSNIKDNISHPLINSCHTETASLAFQHGFSIATGDYIIMQHNDTEYLFDHYNKNDVILDAIKLLNENNYEYITIDKKPVKQTDFKEWNDDIEYFADCYWFLCKNDFYKKHNIWVDWTRGDTNHLSTITCVNKGLKFLHLPFFYESSEIMEKNDTESKIKQFKLKYPEFYKSDVNFHLLNDIPFLIHYKGGTGLRNLYKRNFK